MNFLCFPFSYSTVSSTCAFANVNRGIPRFEGRSKVSFHNTFLYERLLKGPPFDDGLTKWSKNARDLLMSDWMLLPVHTKSHWILVIVGNLRGLRHLNDRHESTTESLDVDRPFIFILDSIESSGVDHEIVFGRVARYICFDIQKSHGLIVDPAAFDLKHPAQVLRQKNISDCGLYLLEHAERFLLSPKAFVYRILHAKVPLEPFDAGRKRR